MSLRGVVVSVTALLFSACVSSTGSGIVLTHDYISHSYYGAELGYAADKGGMPTAVFGTPFDVDKATFDRAVTDAMYRKNPGIAVRFSTEIDDPQRWLYRVIMYFDPPIGISGNTTCNTDSTLQSVPKKGDQLVLLAALCRGNKSLSEIRGTTSRGSGPDDPKFHNLISHVVLNMFPIRNSNVDVDCRQLILLCT